MVQRDTPLATRRLGRTGVEVSVLGLGGFHIGMDGLSDTDAVKLTRAAIDAGITFMDNNWGYHEGRSEERMGEALAGGYRDQVFLMTKFDARSKQDALRELDESLRRLRTDHLDLWQIHEVVYYNDPELLAEPGGALEALDEAKQAGKTRFVGFTGHKDPALHRETLDLFDFDTVQLPLNVMDHHFQSFERQVLPVLLERDLGVIAMKSYGDRVILDSGVVTPEEALRYVLNLPVSTVVKGLEGLGDLEEAIEIARGFTGLSEEEVAAILAKTAPLEISGAGRYELYKTSMKHEADPGRRVHGFPPMEEVPR